MVRFLYSDYTILTIANLAMSDAESNVNQPPARIGFRPFSGSGTVLG